MIVPTEFYTLTDYQPSELKIQPWQLFDEWDQDFSGVLTYETEGAPRLMHIACRRTVKGTFFKLVPDAVYHDDQVNDTFDQKSSERVKEMKT